MTWASDDAPGSCRPSNCEKRGPKISDGALRFVGSARVGCASRRVAARVGGGFFEPSVNVNCYHACRFRGGLRVPLAVRRRASGRLPFSRPRRRDVQMRATDAIQVEFWLGASGGSREGASRNARPRRGQLDEARTYRRRRGFAHHTALRLPDLCPSCHGVVVKRFTRRELVVR